MPVRQHGADGAKLRVYVFHGVNLSAPVNRQAAGDCPFCGKEGHLTVNVDSGLYKCFVCGESGNPLVMIRALYERSRGAVGDEWRAEVADDRRLLYSDTVKAWGACPSVMDGSTWLVPGYGTDAKLDQVYRRVWDQTAHDGAGAWQLRPTPGVWQDGKVHALHMPAGDFDPARPNIIVCEGPWDGMALWEIWDRSGVHNTNIVAAPGANVWRDEWTEMCRGKCVMLMYDSDQAGYDGMVRVAKRLSGVAAQVRYVKWGRDGFDASKPSGYDVRDLLSGV